MKAIDLVRIALQFTEDGTARLVEELRDVPMTWPTPGAKGGNGNHPLWTLGHLAVMEGSIPKILLGEPNPVEHWTPLFGMGTRPSADASVYPSFDEVLSAYRDLRQRNMKLVDSLDDAALNRVPRHIPPGFEEAMPTFGHTLLLIALHNMVHYGQLADARRVAGLKPLI